MIPMCGVAYHITINFLAQCAVDANAVRWLWLIKLMQTLSCEWLWVQRGVLVCLYIYVWSRILLVPVTELKNSVYWLLLLWMVTYTEKYVCTCCTRGGNSRLTNVSLYQIITSYRPLPLSNTAIKGIPWESPGNSLVIIYQVKASTYF